jgi:hypothetical protein
MNYKNKKVFIIGIFISFLLIFYLLKNTSWIIRFMGMISGLIIFYLFDNFFKINFRLIHYFYVFLILFFGIILAPLYFISENYDKFLHFLSPILGSCLIFYVVNKQRLSISWKLLVTFMFIVSFLTIHEIGEYFMDFLWDMKLQGVYIRDVSGLEKLNLVMQKNSDTMVDLIMGVFGSLSFTIGKSISYFYKKKFIL